MDLSKEDMFCEEMTCTAAAKVSTNVLDFHNHGDDILRKMSWSVHVPAVTGAVDKDVVVAWETSDTESFAAASVLASKTIDKSAVVAGAYIVRNEPLPKGLKRYNRLKFTETSGTQFPKVTAFLHTGRDEGTPFTNQ